MIRALSALLAAAAALASSGTAAAAELRLQSLGIQRSAAVASPEQRTTAYLSAPGQLAIGSAGRASRSVAVPVGCTPVAAAAEAIAMTCAPTINERIPVVYDVARRTLSPVRLPTGMTGGITAVGRRWVSISAASSPDGQHTLATRLLIDWRAQRVVSLGHDDPFGADRYIALDAATPARRLCSPIRRRADDGIDDIKYFELTKLGRWTLNFDSVGSVYVQRCGARSKTRLRQARNPVLGKDFVGYVSGRRIVYLDLRTGKAKTRAWPTSQTPTLAAAGRRLIISEPEQGAAYPPVENPTFRIYRTR